MEFDLENPLSDNRHNHGDFPDLSLFEVESDQFTAKNRSFDIALRREAISLISDFTDKFDPFLSYLAVNYLDRFISTRGLTQGKPWVVRLLAVSCVSLAMKMRETQYSVSDIQQNGGIVFDTDTIQRMESLLLGALEWRTRSVTPFSFNNFFISLFKFKDPPLVQALKSRAIEIIFKSQNDIRLLEFKPSIVSASALLSASHELFPLQFQAFRTSIESCSYVNKEDLFSCFNLVQDIAMGEYESVLEVVSSTNTPVNVLDFPCSSDSVSEGVEREVKRRKVSALADSEVLS